MPKTIMTASIAAGRQLIGAIIGDRSSPACDGTESKKSRSSAMGSLLALSGVVALPSESRFVHVHGGDVAVGSDLDRLYEYGRRTALPGLISLKCTRWIVPADANHRGRVAERLAVLFSPICQSHAAR